MYTILQHIQQFTTHTTVYNQSGEHHVEQTNNRRRLVMLTTWPVKQTNCGVVVAAAQAQEIVERNLDDFVETYDGNTDKQTVIVLNLIMEEFDCCGVNGADDFHTK